jgi:hypothetical protein
MKLEAGAIEKNKKAKKAIDLSGLRPTDQEGRVWNVVIETPKGSHQKFKYMPEHGLFGLHRVDIFLTRDSSFRARDHFRHERVPIELRIFVCLVVNAGRRRREAAANSHEHQQR